MKAYIKIVVSLLVSVWFLGSCTETNTVISSNQKPVVEAFLAPGKPISLTLMTVIGYSESADASDSVAKPIDGQTIKVKVSDGSVFTLQSVGQGVYTSKSTEVVKFGLTYTLDFTYNGLPVSAITEIPTRPTGFKLSKNFVNRTQINLSSGTGGFGGPGGFQEDRTPIVATWDNPKGEYHFLAFINTEANPESIVILPTDTTGTNPFRFINRRFNNEPTTALTTDVQPQSFQYFGKHYAVLYRLNPDYAALYKSAGTTTQNISTPPTAITNGLGIFTGVNADTLIFTVYRN
ncbi:DUF4249 family protein [Runella sp.]|uniref:DUF4249 family protein n=1 Tax=Runella sp. TaxID=1960881 RepID=UPI003D0CD144